MATANPIPFPARTEDVLARFTRYLYARRGLAASSVELTSGFAKRILNHSGCTRLTHDDMDAYITELRMSGASYGHVCNASRALELLSDFQGDPIKLGRPRKPQKPPMKTLSEGKIAVLIATAASLRERAILALLAYSGIRNRELISLRVSDVDIPQQAVTVECGKGAKGRVCCVSGDCLEILAEYLHEKRRYAAPGGRVLRAAEPDDFLFVTARHGHQLQTQDIRKLVRVVARRAGLRRRVWPHLLRHSLATALFGRGASVYSIQALLGHSFVSTTMEYYLHPSNKSIRADYQRCVPSFV